MKLKLATWNMAYWSHRKHWDESWDYFLNEINPDVLLFQEAMPNYSILKKDNTLWDGIDDRRKWGSGIYSDNFKIKASTFNNNFKGAVTCGEIEISSELKLIVISLYGLFETVKGISYAMTNLHRIFSDLTELLEFADTRHRIIIGGDLNASTQIDGKYKTHKVFFDRLREFGLHNCFEDFYNDHVQTHRHNRSKKPWQNDYFFISNKLKPTLKNCVVLDTEEIRKYSDHNPVVIELEI